MSVLGRDFRVSMVNIFPESYWAQAAQSWDSHQEIKAEFAGLRLSACLYCARVISCSALFHSVLGSSCKV